MKIFVSHSKNLDYKSKLYEPLKKSELYHNHKIFLPYEDDKLVNTKEVIKNSDLFVAEISEASTGQGIELGWASAFDVPIVFCLSDGTTPPSRSFKFLSNVFIVYKSSADLVQKLTDYVNDVQ